MACLKRKQNNSHYSDNRPEKILKLKMILQNFEVLGVCFDTFMYVVQKCRSHECLDDSHIQLEVNTITKLKWNESQSQWANVQVSQLRQRTSEFQDVIQITLLHFEFKKMLNATK